MEVKTSILGIFSPTQFLKNTPAGISVIFGAKNSQKNLTVTRERVCLGLKPLPHFVRSTERLYKLAKIPKTSNLYQVSRFCGPGDLGWLAPLAKRASEGGTCDKYTQARVSLLTCFGVGNFGLPTMHVIWGCLRAESAWSKLTMLRFSSSNF
jgi:hypothetical protein